MADEEKKDDSRRDAAGRGRRVRGSCRGGGLLVLADDAAGEESAPTPPAEEAEASSDDSPDADARRGREAPDASCRPEERPPGGRSPAGRRRGGLESGSRRPHEAGPQLSDEERAAKRAEARKAKSKLRRKQRAALKAEGGAAGTGTPPAEHETNAAKVRQGIVVSDKGEKSITVRIDIVRRHPTYEKVVRRSRTLHAHDERNEAGEGDTVRVVETRPLSKTKRWRLVEVLEKAK